MPKEMKWLNMPKVVTLGDRMQETGSGVALGLKPLLMEPEERWSLLTPGPQSQLSSPLPTPCPAPVMLAAWDWPWGRVHTR